MWGSQRETEDDGLLFTPLNQVGILFFHQDSLAVNSGSANSLQCGIWWRGPKIPHGFPCALIKGKMDFSGGHVTAIAWNALFIHPECHHEGGITMEMCDTLVDKLSISRWASSSPAWAFERFDRPFLSLGFAQTVVYLRALLAFLFHTVMDFVQCVV